ncbi:MAG: ABC transporter ATP-binding protein [Candidatus Bipolaricaulota bacterium]|nr:ABC transporter ATP-binding protein [Candidatus Bipolaricaulota bacterium]
MRLWARGVGYAYVRGKPVLQGITLEVRAGEILFLLGPNGSGKTTLLDLLGGLRLPGEGEVALDGRPLSALSPRARARAIASVPQFHEPPFNFTAWEVVLMGRAPYVRLLGQPGPRDRAAADRALEALGLTGLRDRPYYTLSGGERRLVVVARGLAQGASFLLLDEPDAHLDPANQHRVLRAVGGLVEGGLGVVATSHSPNNALLYAHRVALLAVGRLLSVGSPPEVVTPDLLQNAYGIPFVLVGDAPRAVLPALT